MRLEIALAIYLCTIGHAACYPSRPTGMLTLTPARRDLLKLLGENTYPAPVAEPSKVQPTMPVVLPATPSVGQVSRTVSTSAVFTKSATANHLVNTGTEYPATSITTASSTPTNLQTTEPSDGSSEASTSQPLPTPPPGGWVGDTSTTPPAELTQWKVIGIGVITVTLIAIIIVSVSFFDAWWSFVREAMCCGRWRGKKDEREGEEKMVPDWEMRRSWEFRLANEEGHRYPTLASLESIVKEKESLRHQWTARDSIYEGKITTPELAYGVSNY